jgi:hypothetical protein
MKQRDFRSILLLAAFLASTFTAAGQVVRPFDFEIGTNESVLKMNKAGWDVASIINKLKSLDPKHTHFDTSPEALSRLRFEGLSQEILDVMSQISFEEKSLSPSESYEQSTQTAACDASNGVAAKTISVNPLPSAGVTATFLCNDRGNHCAGGSFSSYVAGRTHTGLDVDTSSDAQNDENKVRSTLPGIVPVEPASNITCTNCRDDRSSVGLGNSVVVEHLLDNGELIKSLYGHMQYLQGRQPFDLVAGARIVAGQNLGYKGGTGPAVGTHLHFEITSRTPPSAAATANSAPHWILENGVANSSSIVQDPEPFRQSQRRILLPYLSSRNAQPCPLDYEVYGIVDVPLYAAILLNLPTTRTFTHIGVGGRRYDTPSVNTDVFDKANASFASGQTQITGDPRIDLTPGDYRFFAYVNSTGNRFDLGYPLKYSILPNAQSKIIDNDSLTGYSGNEDAAENVAGYYLSAKLFKSGNAQNFAEWRPALRNGNYEVYVHVPDAASADSVTYTIYPDGITPVVSNPVNHAANRDRWVQLTVGAQKSWNFNGNGYAQLPNSVIRATPQDKKIGADAVKFIAIDQLIISDYGVAANTKLRVVSAGETAEYTISTQTKSGSPQNISLTVTNVPAGASATIVPQTITTGQSSTLRVVTSPFQNQTYSGDTQNAQAGVAPPGDYTMTITGVGSTSRSDSVVLSITALPKSVILMGGGGQTGGNGSTLNYVVQTGGSVKVDFNALGSIPNSSSIVAYEWRSNGTSISNLPTFSFLFGAGSHNITLKVTNSAGLSDTAMAIISMNQTASSGPQAVISMNSGGQSGGNNSTLNYTVAPGGSINMSFSGTGSQAGAGNTINAYEWRSNGTVISTLSTFNFPFAAASHTITLKVTNSAGLSSTATSTIIVTENTASAPTAVIGMSSGGQTGTNGSTVNYTVSPGGSISMLFNGSGSQPGTGSITNYEWRSNGTVISNLSSFSYPFAAASHTITLKVTNSAGLSNTATATIIVSQSSATSPKAVIFMSGGGKSGGNGATLNYVVPSGSTVNMSFDGSASTPGTGSIVAREWRSNGTIINTGSIFNFAFGPATHVITLKVTNSSGASDTATATIVITAGPSPSVSSINPNPVPVFNANQNVQVSGNNFQTNLSVDVFNGSGSKVGTLSGSAQIQNVNTNSFTMVILLGSSAGTFGIEVVNPDGGRSARFTFQATANNPSVSSLSPSSPPVVNGNQSVGVNGSSFQSGLTVDVYNSSGTKTGTLSGSGQIQNVTPNSFTMVISLGSTAGTFGIEVVNPNGGRSSRFTFSTQATAPTVSSISPNPVPVFNANQNVQVSGNNFQTNLSVDVFNSSGSKIGTLSGTGQIQNVNTNSFTMVVSLGSSAGTFGIEVVNPDGGRSTRFTFQATANNPSVSSLNPSSPPAISGNQSVGVNGGSFQSGLTVDVYNSSGSKIGTLSGSAQIQNVTPNSFTMVINLGSTAGTFGIEVVNPNGGRSSRFTFSSVAPSVSSISPNPVPVFNANQDVQVSGNNFQTNLTVDVFNSSGSKIGTLSGSGQIKNVNTNSFTMVIFLGSSAGTFGIEVVNPNGSRSARFTFQATANNPSVSSLSPSSPPVVNNNQSVGVNGSSFQSGLTVDVYNSSGTKLGTLSGSGQIQNVTANSFTMVINLGATAGTFGIEVVNPNGGRSSRFTFSTH